MIYLADETNYGLDPQYIDMYCKHDDQVSTRGHCENILLL